MKKYLIIFAFILSSSIASAQESIFHIGWDVAVPTGELEEYIGEVSARGLTIGGRKFLYDFISVGGKTGWQTFYARYDGTQEVNENLDITGVQLRYLNVFPIMANVFYYLGQDEGVRPYLGTNVGITFSTQRTEIGLFSASQNSTHFGIAPEVGVLIPIGLAGGGLIVSARYEQAFKSDNNFQIQYFTFNLAFNFAH